MLTQQSSSTKTVALAADSFLIGFVISDDGRTLLAVTGTEEGSLELLTTPVSLIHPNGTILSPQLKVNNAGSVDTTGQFQINLENIVGESSNQQTILLGNPNNIRIAIDENMKSHEESPGNNVVQIGTNRINDLVDNVTEVPDVQKKGPGRPKKDPSVPSSKLLQCEICGEEFKKQMLYRKHMEHHAEEKPHRCPKCPASFNIPSNFTLHMAIHNTGDPKCPECGRKFARMASLKAHMMIHEKEENLFCTECEDAFSTKAQLDAHLKLHNEKWSSEDVRKCKLCNKQFTQPALYRLHIREHYRLQAKIMKQTKRGITQKTVYKCKICTKVFQKPSQLMRHIRVHTGEKPFKCNVCARGFTQKSSLQIHMWQHVGIRPFTCDKCNAKFSQKGNLNAHILRVHNAPEGEPIYACNQCSCIFKKLGSLNGHIKKMHAVPADETPRCDSSTEKTAESQSDKQAKSDILQQALTNSGLSDKEKTEGAKKSDAQTSYVTLVDRTPDGSLRKYVTIKQRRIGAIRWYACSFCHKEFKKPSDLIRHLRVHTQEKPFKCSYCHRSFALKSTMKAHERTHFGTKKYSCGICGKMFACHSSLTAHTRTHTKPHKCSVCDMSFSTSTVLKSHMKSHSKPKSKLSPEAERLVPQIVLEEPLVISDAGNKISVAHVQSKQRHVYNTEDEGNRPHKCWACPAAFRKISHLKQHYRRHTGERPYKCPKCDRRFTSNSVLKAHLHTHEEARPFSCNVCNATFSTQSSQKRHLVTHSNKRPFMCPYCHKTFKTSVNCRKHMKIHKNELAQQQLEKQRGAGEVATEKIVIQEKQIRSTVLGQNLSLPDDMEVHFQGNINADFGFTESLQIIEEKEKGLLAESSGAEVINQNLPAVEPHSLGTSTQTLHADETGTITLPNYTGEQTLTAESIREIEETLNQQLYTIGLGNLDLSNNLTRQINDSGSAGLEAREQPVLNIIYDNQKVLDSTVQTASIFGSSHFDTFDMSQITLQADTEIDMGISSANSTSMASILPRSAQEEQRLIPVSNCRVLDHQTSQSKPERQLVVVSSLPEAPRQPISRPKFPKIIAKADTTELLNLDNEPSLDKSLSISPDKITLSSFQNTSDLSMEPQISNIYEVSEMINKESQLQCHICMQKGFSAATLKEHLKSHRGSKEFQCPECSMKFCTNGGLTRHLKVHNNKQTESYNCSTCFESFPTDVLLKRHAKSHDLISWNVTNGTIEPDSSQKDSVAVDPDLLTINLRNTETDSSVSEKVLMDSVAERDMIKHLDNGETKEKKEYTNKCKYCPKTFRKPSDLIRHIRTHTGERPYQCKHCEKSFAVKCTLDCHMKVHDGTKSFCCHVCNSLFATKGSLKVHMRLHTGSKPFKCLICDQRFRTSGHRKVHVLTHMKDGKENGNKRKGRQKKTIAAEIPEKTVENINPVEFSTNEYPNIDTITIDATGIGDQLSFNPDGAILNNNSVLSVNESNQLVANLHFLLSNGLVTIQTDESSLLQLNTGDGNISQADGNLITDNLREAENNLVIATQLEGLQDQQGLGLNNCTTLVQMPQAQPSTVISTSPSALVTQKPNQGRVKNATKKECDICGKTFRKPCQVERHKRIHTGERLFKCELCDKSFAQKVTLQMHQRHHTGDRPYSCPHCNYSFTQKGNLQTHLRRVHQLDTIEGKKLRRGQQLSAKTPEPDNQLNVNRLLNLDNISLVEFLK